MIELDLNSQERRHVILSRPLLPEPRFEASSTNGGKQQISLEIVDRLERQVEHFCDFIRGKAKPAPSVRDSVANLKVVDAISRSARTGELIRL